MKFVWRAGLPLVSPRPDAVPYTHGEVSLSPPAPGPILCHSLGHRSSFIFYFPCCRRVSADGGCGWGAPSCCCLSPITSDPIHQHPHFPTRGASLYEGLGNISKRNEFMHCLGIQCCILAPIHLFSFPSLLSVVVPPPLHHFMGNSEQFPPLQAQTH